MKFNKKLKRFVLLPMVVLCAFVSICLFLIAGDMEEQNKLNETASKHLADKQYQAAIDLAGQSLDIGTFGKSNNAESIKSHLILGIGYNGLDDKINGYRHLNAALDISLDLCGESNINTFNVLYSMANVFRGEGDLEEARDAANRALLVIQSLDADTREEAECHRLLVEIHSSLDDKDKVIAHTKELLAIFKKQPDNEVRKNNIKLCNELLKKMKDK